MLGKEYGFEVNKEDKIEGFGDHECTMILGDIYVISKHDFQEMVKEEGVVRVGEIYYYRFTDWKDGYKIEKVLGESEEKRGRYIMR